MLSYEIKMTSPSGLDQRNSTFHWLDPNLLDLVPGPVVTIEACIHVEKKGKIKKRGERKEGRRKEQKRLRGGRAWRDSRGGGPTWEGW